MNVKAPESLVNSEKAAMPLEIGGSQELWEGAEVAVLYSELRPPGFVSVACPHDVLRVCRVSPHSQSTLFSGKNTFPEFSRVCVAGATLH